MRTFTGNSALLRAGGQLKPSEWSTGSTFLSVRLECKSDKWSVKFNDSAGFSKPSDNELRALDTALESLQAAASHRIADRHDDTTATAGEAAVVGRYKKIVDDVVRARWYQLVNDNMSALTKKGAVTIHFVVTPAGKTSNVSVATGDERSVFGKLCTQAVQESDLPPVPEAVQAALGEKPFEIDFTFSFGD